MQAISAAMGPAMPISPMAGPSMTNGVQAPSGLNAMGGLSASPQTTASLKNEINMRELTIDLLIALLKSDKEDKKNSLPIILLSAQSVQASLSASFSGLAQNGLAAYQGMAGPAQVSMSINYVA